MVLGHFFTQSIASCSEETFQTQNPAMSSFVSANGPSVTVRFEPENRTRAPRELGSVKAEQIQPDHP